MNEALAGHVPLAVGSVFLAKRHIDGKRVLALALRTSKRSPVLPDVPTMAENSFPGFEAPAWWALLVPARTPAQIIRRMDAELDKVHKLPDVAKPLDAQGIDLVRGSSEMAHVFIERQVDIWGKVVRDSNIKADGREHSLPALCGASPTRRMPASALQRTLAPIAPG